MSRTININIRACIPFALELCLLLMTIGGCKAPPDIFTVGIVAYADSVATGREGFKDGMAELGYIENENIRYVNVFLSENNDQMTDLKIKELLSQDVDLILTSGPIILKSKEILKGDLPILFGGDAYPVESGMVRSLKHPGGNITGVKTADNISKALEWLTTIANGAKKVYLPYGPDDSMSIRVLSELNKAASELGIELVIQKVSSVEETIAAIEDLPKDIDAVFMVPSKILNPRSNELNRAAIKRSLPTGAAIKLDEEVLVTFSSDFYNVGKKTARLAQQIQQGAKPSDLPVETADTLLIINLKTAEKIGVMIPDSILAQATTIIR